MGAINLLDQSNEIIVRDRFLIMLKHVPTGGAKDTEIISGLPTGVRIDNQITKERDADAHWRRVRCLRRLVRHCLLHLRTLIQTPASRLSQREEEILMQLIVSSRWERIKVRQSNLDRCLGASAQFFEIKHRRFEPLQYDLVQC